MHTKNGSINLKKTSLFIGMPKKNLAIWLVEGILDHNSRTKILPDMALVVEYQ